MAPFCGFCEVGYRSISGNYPAAQLISFHYLLPPEVHFYVDEIIIVIFQNYVNHFVDILFIICYTCPRIGRIEVMNMAKVATNRERLCQLFDADSKNDTEIAKALGVSKQSISMWRNGDRSPKMSMVQKIADYYGASVEWLMGWDLPAPSILTHTLPANLIPISQLKMHKIPLLGSVAAGEPIYDPEFPGIIVESPTDADFALKIKGDSMEPSFMDGDLVFVKQVPDVPHDGCVCVMAIDDEATLKRVYRQKDGVMLISGNPAYSPMFYKCTEHAIRVLGVPVGFTRMLK